MGLRIVFMGTPEFAVASLQALVEAGQNVVAVITAPDKPSGRGLQLNQSAVKTYALSQNIPVLQPEKLKNPTFLEELKSYKADLQVVVAFRMLPEVVWNMPAKGTFNLHASLLPQYRGAAPINWAIINGETVTGVTTFFLRHDIDTGPMVDQVTCPILPEDTIGTLYPKLMAIGAGLVVKTVKNIEEGSIVQKDQVESATLYHAPKIFKETCAINWAKSATEIHNLVRGLSPYPAAFTQIGGKSCKIFQTQILESSPEPIEAIGDFLATKKELLVKCAQGYISILELQLEGKKRMNVEDFLRGNKLV
jgi:methionyl-tRNA formyltransferase